MSGMVAGVWRGALLALTMLLAQPSMGQADRATKAQFEVLFSEVRAVRTQVEGLHSLAESLVAAQLESDKKLDELITQQRWMTRVINGVHLRGGTASLLFRFTLYYFSNAK